MSSLPEKFNELERVAELYLKSYKPNEIARALNITTAQAKAYIRDYKQIVSERVAEDPDFLDRVQENVSEALERLDTLVKEAWETYDTAKSADLINQQTNLLKVIGAFEQQRAAILQLLGAKMDSGMMARMQRAERVNEIVSRIIKDVVAECDHCKTEVMPRLAEAFAAMGREQEAADMRPVSDEPIIDTDGDEVEEAEWSEADHENMMGDIVAYD